MTHSSSVQTAAVAARSCGTSLPYGEIVEEAGGRGQSRSCGTRVRLELLSAGVPRMAQLDVPASRHTYFLHATVA